MKRLTIAAAMFVVAACAHQPQPVVTSPAAEPGASKAAPAPAAAPASESATTQKDADLEKLLNGLVIRFGFDAADLTPDSRQRLDAIADAMRARPAAHIRIAGNCDELGTVEYNLALGQKRADAVRTYLVTLGVGGNRVDTVSYGEEKPVDEGHTEAAWAANRRAEVSPTN